MKMNKIFIKKIKLLGLIGLLVGCSTDDNSMEPIENNPNAPGQVENVSVENLPGKARIKYTLPTDQDLLYIKAQYTLENGREMESKASYYKNSMLLEGFSGTSESEVEIYSVNRSEVASEPITVSVNPEEAPLFDVFESLEVGPGFGGVYVDANNPNRDDIAILIMEKDENGDWVENPNSVYTSTNNIYHTLRGMDTIEKEFAFTVRDRWLNYSDTLFTDIAPLYETAIPKSQYTGIIIDGDTQQHPSTPLSGLWDGEIMNWPSVFLTEGTIQDRDHMFTMDLGEQVKLSRIVIWDYPEYVGSDRVYYYRGAMREFEIYGTDVLPSENQGDLSNWTHLGSYESVKPSGLPYGQQNNEDYETANSGISYELPLEAPKMRYLRIVNKKNWEGRKNLAIAELQVYGDPR